MKFALLLNIIEVLTQDSKISILNFMGAANKSRSVGGSCLFLLDIDDKNGNLATSLVTRMLHKMRTIW